MLMLNRWQVCMCADLNAKSVAAGQVSETSFCLKFVVNIYVSYFLLKPDLHNKIMTVDLDLCDLCHWNGT